MGSKFSKAVRPHVKAVASPVATAPNANEETARQGSPPQLPDKFGSDDIDVVTLNTTPATSQRRYSEPAQPTAVAVDSNMEHPRDTASRLGLLRAQYPPAPIENESTVPTPAPAAATLPPPPPPPPPLEPEVQCLICCTQLPKEKDPMHAKQVIKPCHCASMYCTNCIKNMFIEACKDSTRMPPRCCKPIHLHHARPYLSQEEIAEFRLKYEEWSTPNPRYCPVPTCSAFIPERLVPQQATGKRADSGIGTPTANTFGCPTCKADICLDCRQRAHPASMCNVTEFGIDSETEALLKSWGYKKCPKCGNGLKRMFGCNHMACRCGANFCWVCLMSREVCGGGCYDGDEYDDSDEEEPDNDVVPDEPGEPASQPDPTGNIEPNGERLPEAIPADAASEAPGNDTTPTTTPPRPIPGPRNLDGGSSRYWEERDLDFGDEPTDDVKDRSWYCQHDFATYKISLATALTGDTSTTEVECVKCWCNIRPEIEIFKNRRVSHDTMVPPIAGGRGRGIGRARGRARGRYMPLGRLLRADATMGTDSQPMAPISPLSQSVPTREVSPMEDVQYHDGVVDTYGNVIVTMELDAPRRASLDTSLDSVVQSGRDSGKKPLDHYEFTFNAPSDVSTDTATKFSLAHECRQCGLLVCEPCRDATLAAQEALERDREMED